MSEALAILEGLPKGWDWSINKHGPWYHVVISNSGLKHEPVYSNGDMGTAFGQKLNTPSSRDLLACVKFAYEAYRSGEGVSA